MTCADSESMSPRPKCSMRSCASRVLSRSSTSSTRRSHRAASSSANPLASAQISLSLPSMLSGSPTSRTSGCQRFTRSSIARQSGRLRPCRMLGSGVADAVKVCPLATPILLVPKSKAMMLKAALSSTPRQESLRLLRVSAPAAANRCRAAPQPHQVDHGAAHRTAHAHPRGN